MATETGVKTVLEKLKYWLKKNQAELQNAGVAQIIGTYSGSGDEGNFDSVGAVDAKGMPASYDLSSEAIAMVVSVAYKVAAPGYEEGDGGGGKIVLDVATATIKHTSYWNEIVEHPDQEL